MPDAPGRGEEPRRYALCLRCGTALEPLDERWPEQQTLCSHLHVVEVVEATPPPEGPSELELRGEQMAEAVRIVAAIIKESHAEALAHPSRRALWVEPKDLATDIVIGLRSLSDHPEGSQEHREAEADHYYEQGYKAGRASVLPPEGLSEVDRLAGFLADRSFPPMPAARWHAERFLSDHEGER